MDFRLTEADLYSFITQCKLAVLGTAGEGSPQTALVGIAVTPKLEVIFDTVSSSRKFQNMKTNSRCSFVIGWSGEQTVQYEGQAQQLQSPELEQYCEFYFKAWPDGRARMNWAGIAYFVVRPNWIRFSDYSQDPPLIHEFNFLNTEVCT